MYLGARHARVRDQRHDDLIDAYVTTATRLYPNAMLHWEDFGAGNARRILNKYADQVCAFNDDMQGPPPWYSRPSSPLSVRRGRGCGTSAW